jgi:hypothetical protein
MPIPAEYSYDNGGWIWKNDGTGPYSISPTGVATFLGGSVVSASYEGFSQGVDGLYYFTDGSGPYAKGSDGMYKFLV